MTLAYVVTFAHYLLLVALLLGGIRLVRRGWRLTAAPDGRVAAWGLGQVMLGPGLIAFVLWYGSVWGTDVDAFAGLLGVNVSEGVERTTSRILTVVSSVFMIGTSGYLAFKGSSRHRLRLNSRFCFLVALFTLGTLLLTVTNWLE